MKFPKLQIGQTGTFAGQTITRISLKLYSRQGSCLDYSRKSLEAFYTGPYSGFTPIKRMSFQEFKQLASEFFTLVKKMQKPEQVAAGFDALGIAFLHADLNENERHQACILMELASRKQDELLLKAP